MRAACEHLASPDLPSDPAGLLGALGRAVGVFYNHTGDLACLSFKEGPNPETGGLWGELGQVREVGWQAREVCGRQYDGCAGTAGRGGRGGLQPRRHPGVPELPRRDLTRK